MINQDILIARLTEELAEVRAQRERAVGVLRQWEFEGFNDECLSCGQVEEDGHTPDCQLSAAISDTPALDTPAAPESGGEGG